MARVLVSPGPGALRDALAAAADGDTLALAPGVWHGPVIIRKPITLQAAGAFGSAVIRGGSGATVRVELDDPGRPAPPPVVWLRGLVIHGAAAQVGPCVEQRNPADTRIDGCLLTDGRGAGAGGGGLAVYQGRVIVTSSRLVGCRALRGGAVRASGVVRVVLRHSLIADCHGEDAGGALEACGGASVALVGCTLGGHRAPSGRDLYITGGAGRRTSVALDHCLLALDGRDGSGRVTVRGAADLTVQRSALPPAAIDSDEPARVTYDAHTLQRAVPVHADGPDAWRPLLPAMLAPLGDAETLTRAAAEATEAPRLDTAGPVDLNGEGRRSVFVGALNAAG
jgi:hypothetical protein